MENEKLVSIITPIYDTQKYISETIESVINRIYQNWEMIIIDNFSTDYSINTVLMKKDLIIKFRDIHLVVLEYLYFWIENLMINKKVYLIKENLINYRVLRKSASNRSSDQGFRKLYYLYSLLLNEKKITYLILDM